MLQEIMDMISEINPYEDFDEDTMLFEQDILDSLGFMQLVINMEDRFGMQIDEKLILKSNFETARLIEAFIKKLLENQSGDIE